MALSVLSCTWSTDLGGDGELSCFESVTFALAGAFDDWVASGVVVAGVSVVVVDVVVVVVVASVAVCVDAVVLSFTAALSGSVVSLTVVLSAAADADVAASVSPASVAAVSSAVTTVFSRHKEDTKVKSTTLNATMLRIPSWWV